MSIIKDWWERAFAAYARKKLEKRYRGLAAHSKALLQVMEFQGELYLSYDGAPLVKADALRSSVTDELNAARETWIEWMNRESGI